jgi:hypothetical protein
MDRGPKRTREDVIRAAALLLLAAVSASCGRPATPAAHGAARLAIAARAPDPGVTAAVVTIGGPDFAPFVEPLSDVGTGWSALVTGIPAGPARSFDVVAYDAVGSPLYRGSATSDIAAGAVADVTIILEGAPAPTFGNAAPIIDSFWASQVTVAPGGTVQLGVTAHDPDPGDTITYRWVASCGVLDDALAPVVTWTAPDVVGSCDVSVTVSDASGGSVTTHVTVDAS